MEKKLQPLKNKLLLFFFFVLSVGIFGQTPLVNYQFSNNLTADAGALITSSLTYLPGTVTPAYNGDRLHFKSENQGNYVELNFDATLRQNLVVSWKGEYGGALFGSAQFTLQIYNGTAWVDDPATMNLNIINDSRTQIVALPVNYNNNSAAKLRIKATSVGDGLLLDANLYLDNLIITSGAPKIKMHSDSNVEIPNNADAATGYNTVFGDLQTLLAPGESKTYRVRNLQGTVGSNLNVTSIQIEPASGTSVNDFVVEVTNGLNALPSVNDVEYCSDPRWWGCAEYSDTKFGTITIRFIPQGEGVRQATVRVYSNGTPSPYSFTVIGGGRSCDIKNTAYVINTADIGVQTLPSDLGTSDFVGGTTAAPNSNGSLTAFYPRPGTGSYDLFTSSSTSWFTKDVEKTKTFGGINISNLKNVSVEFNVAAFANANSNAGVTTTDYIILSVTDKDGNWYDVMQLNGSDRTGDSRRRQYQFNTSGKIYTKNYALPLTVGTTVSNTNSSTSTGSSGGAYARFQFNIPLQYSKDLNDFKFRIKAKANANAVWLIDDIRITSDNASFKTWNTNAWQRWNGTAWVADTAPGPKEKAIINTGTYTNSGNSTICECEVMSGASLTIPNNTSVTLQGKLINHGDENNVVVESDGNLIQIEDGAVNSGSITAERLVSDINNISTHMDYLYWSAPVSGQGLKAFSPGTPDNRIFQYNEPNDLFKAVPLATEPNFVPGKGYAFRAESGTGISNPYSKTYKFKGVPNNGLIEREVQRSPNTGAAANVVHGYNLIGNPYPSNMSFEQFYQLNKNVIYNTAWFWTNNFFTPNQQGSGYGQNNYAVWNGTGGVAATTAPADSNPSNPTSNTTTPNGIVTVGQGFIVQVKNLGLGQKVQFRNRNGNTPLRVANAGTFFSRQNEEKDRFWLKLISADSIINSQLIGYIDGATNGFEQDYDAELMGMSSDVFYSLLEDRRLQIQGKAAFDPSDKVQLGANIFKNGTYTIAIENPEGIFNAGQKVYLKDNLLNRWVDLNAQAYTFEATKGITEGRFEIVYESPTVLATDAVTKDELMVYRDSGDFVVKAKSKKMTMVEVYDASGRLVYTAKPNDTKVVISGDRLNRGVYILKISQDGVVTAKKILK